MPPKIKWMDIIKAYKFKHPKWDGGIGEIKITYDDIFHLKNLYKMVYEWLSEEGFIAQDGDNDFYEDFYLEKHHAGGIDYWFHWNMYKQINNYYRYKMTVKFQTIALNKVKIKYEGKELGMYKGEITIFINAEVETDWKGQWEKHWLLKHFKAGYDKIIYYHELNNMQWMNLYRGVYRLQAIIKGYLNLRALGPTHGLFHPMAEGIEGRWPKV